jgi:hypothetical protein
MYVIVKIHFSGKAKLVYAVVGLWVFDKMTGGMQLKCSRITDLCFPDLKFH